MFSVANELPIEHPQSKIVNRLPRLALIAEGFTDAAVAERTAEAVRAGAPWVQLRDHPASEAAFAEAARALAERLRQETPDVLISINSRPDAAEMIGAGLHTGRHGPSVKEARERLPEDALVGASAHDAGEARAAAGADYLFFSPIFPTPSKPDHPGAGLDALQSFCETFSNTPVLALGGISPERTAPCRAAGAHGVAVTTRPTPHASTSTPSAAHEPSIENRKPKTANRIDYRHERLRRRSRHPGRPQVHAGQRRLRRERAGGLHRAKHPRRHRRARLPDRPHRGAMRCRGLRPRRRRDQDGHAFL
ncbi:MAG: hypothetical protein BRD44_04805 [Bacteroidetes bacterium QS_7_67_15]|nr:MAG: hypothetical protein BRD44_04805 [Bacteroidetes bacterium QS_7_67_15]